ncbi:MAG: triose-phosphate isomerase [Legionellaceae bacterium]|nr:triose-phosphate isomerase [Legionellaceae bacterium]
MRKKYILGNWKMNGTSETITSLLEGLTNQLPETTPYKCAVLPPSLYIQQTKELLKNSYLEFGSQNVYPKDSGAFTGEISGTMLEDIGCKYVLVGHSERRHLLNETNAFVAEKFHYVKSSQMVPVLCIGETLEEYEQGLTEQVLAKQLLAVVSAGDFADPFANCIVAYEPVWAIGTGKTATPEQAQSVHKFIRHLVREFGENYAKLLPIVYGGSVNEKNSSSLFSMPDIDGGLIGGAALDAQKFAEIIKTAT